VIETDATLERKSAQTLEAHFGHRYDITHAGAGSRIVYTGRSSAPCPDGVDPTEVQRTCSLGEDTSVGGRE
jgi:hypothetical protein